MDVAERSTGPEERLVKRVVARLRCASCRRQHAAENVDIMGCYGEVWIVGVNCPRCDRPGMFVVSVRKDSSLERVTDLTEDEQARFVGAASVEESDVEGMRHFLAEFGGDFNTIFKRPGGGRAHPNGG